MKDKELAVILGLQQYGLTQSEILQVDAIERKNLLNALEDAEMRNVSCSSILKPYMKNYDNYVKFSQF